MRTLLVLPTTLGLLLTLSAPARAQDCQPRTTTTWNVLNGRVVVRTSYGDERIPRAWRSNDCGAAPRVDVYETAPRCEPATRCEAPRWEAPRYQAPRCEPAPRCDAPRWEAPAPRCESTGRTAEAPRYVDTGRTERPRGPAAWRYDPCAPRPAPRCERPAPARCESAPQVAFEAPAEWTTPSQPCVPKAWRDALSSSDWLDLHARLRAAVDCPRDQLQLLDGLARKSTLSVDQAVGLVATIRASRDRLAALTLLHPAITDRAAFGRAYPLLAPEDAELLHYRVTRVTEGCVDPRAQVDPRAERLARQERELQELLGDVAR